METFDDIEIHRPELARGYLQLLKAQPQRPLALFAPRRVGKTFFLDTDLTPLARKAGFITVYADLWLNKAIPLEAINHALEEALDDVIVPTSAVGKVAKAPVKRIGGIEFGQEPKLRPLPTQPALRLDALVGRLSKLSGKRVLLMLDEIQILGRIPDGDSVVASLRAVLQKRRREASAVFTGSSQEELSAMVAAAGGPMYQFAQLMDFPVLGEEYPELLANHFSKVHKGKRLDLAHLREVFAWTGYKPALLKDLVKSMSADGMTGIDIALQNMMKDEKLVAGWRGLLADMKPIERGVLVQIARGKSPLGQETLQTLRGIAGLKPTISKLRTAVDNLKAAGVLSKPAGSYLIEDRLFADYLARTKSPLAD